MWFKNKPVGLDYFEAAPFRFVNECELNATPEEVFAILADGDTWATWFSDFRSVTWLTPEPRRAGSQRHVVLKSLQAKEEFLAWEPGRRMAFYMLETTLPITACMAEDYQLEPLPNGRSKLSWTAAYTPKPLARVIHPLLRVIFGRMFLSATEGLKRYVAAGHRS